MIGSEAGLSEPCFGRRKYKPRAFKADRREPKAGLKRITGMHSLAFSDETKGAGEFAFPSYRRTGSTLPPSISTATDLCKRSTEMINFSFPSLIFRRNPSQPFKGPSTTRTICPSFR
jgi:hypothetical protein